MKARICRSNICSLLLLLGAALVSPASLSAAPIDPADPCNPGRKFCGRLSITVAGAGRESGDYTLGTKGVDADLPDPTSNYTNSNFHQFRRNDPTSMPSYSIVIASEPILKAKLDNLPK